MDASAYDAWYATPRGRWIGSCELDLIRGSLAAHPGESLLDVGCGTGYFTRGLAKQWEGPVSGVDINPAWVAFATQRDDLNIAWLVVDAQALPFEDKSVDLIVSVTALCFIKDKRLAVRKMVRAARRRSQLLPPWYPIPLTAAQHRADAPAGQPGAGQMACSEA